MLTLRLREIDMNWKHLSLAALFGLSLIACDSKKEEKKADEAAPAEAAKVEEHKADEAKPAEEHKAEEHKAGEAKPAETPKEEHKEEKKAS